MDAGYKTAEAVPKPNIIAKAIGRLLLLFKIGTLVGEALAVAVFVREAAAETDETSFIMVLFFIDGGDKVRNGKSVLGSRTLVIIRNDERTTT